MIYFDNAASTCILQSAADKMREVQFEYFANPSSASILGLNAQQIIKNSAKTFANIINSSQDEIYFTSGGTEGNNWAIFGTAKGYKRSGKHIITTSIEHAAVKMPFEALKEEGFEVTYIPVDKKGYIDLEFLSNAIREDTILVSIIMINNEVGTIQDIEKIGKLIKEKNPQCIFHTDAVQAFGKYKINVKKMNIDILTMSGHKIHGPKGIGMIYIKKNLKVKPIILGGGQQFGQRSGTENTSGISALALAAIESYKTLEENSNRVKEVKQALMSSILSDIPQVYINGDNIHNASPYILNLAFKGVKSEVLLHALEEKEIYVSAGSACDSRKKISSVLHAMGISNDLIDGSIRFSFSRFNTVDEAKKCLEVLKEIVPVLRRINMKR